MGKIKVLIVDDSAFVRSVFLEKLSQDSEIEVVGAAEDAYIAKDMIRDLDPEIILLDIEMPRMNGLTFLERIMRTTPKKVIIVSSLAEQGGEIALKALELGALEVIAKPGEAYSVEEMVDQLIDKIKAVHSISIDKSKEHIPALFDKHKTSGNKSLVRATNKIIAIGASTGGTEAIQYILERMPVNCPPIIIVQHMPHYFTKSFANRLNDVCEIKVKEAENREIIAPGKALIAPGNMHMELSKSGVIYNVRLMDGPLVYRQRPAVERLFQSTAQYAGKNAIGVILTGMGKDGAQGLLKMKEEGSYNIAQDEKSCVVFGMPKEAIEIGAVHKILPLNQIAQEIIKESER
ncbi:MAG: chemotaxis response regulator protein-glutamate methylesterase [Firmicutes bacterium HGW-Firmicutes-1]|jgi:two-component system chemotaxis response regulator CheB|nr:MAG: chemotaxis response regulator protein-glutamate methylesterase [Firmicutes bacterium HGW-Firmicutes-1]